MINKAGGSMKDNDKGKTAALWRKSNEGEQSIEQKTYVESQEAQGYTWEQVAARMNENCDQDDLVGQLKVTEEQKAPVLWTVQCEEVEQSV